MGLAYSHLASHAMIYESDMGSGGVTPKRRQPSNTLSKYMAVSTANFMAFVLGKDIHFDNVLGGCLSLGVAPPMPLESELQVCC